MKLARFTSWVVVGLLLLGAATGCKKKSGFVTPLPNAGTAKTAPRDPGTSGALRPSDPFANGGGLTAQPLTGDDLNKQGGAPMGPGHEGWLENADMFKENTVFFAFDSAAVGQGEAGKVSAVADYLKANQRVAVKVEGHCDERGTEEYNLALGVRRATSVREELIKLGIDPLRVDTVSYGETRPAVIGSGESTWEKNRRGVFVLLTPPQ